jgi:hypothetical protein
VKLKFVLFSIAYIALFSTVTFSQTTGQAEDLHAADIAIYEQLRKVGVRYETKRVILWIEKDGLTQREIEDFGTLVNLGIVEMEKFTGIKFDKKYVQNPLFSGANNS